MSLEIRPLDDRASAEVRAELDRILEQCRPALVDREEHLAKVEERIGEVEGDRERRLYYATVGRQAVGLVDAVLFRPDSSAACIAQLAVAPQKRLHGTGRALVDRVVEDALAEGLTSLVAAVKAPAQEAAVFWRALGLEEIEASGGVRVFRRDL